MIVAEHDTSRRARIREIAQIPGVRAGSALLRARGKLLVVQDDAPAIALLDPRTRAFEARVLEGDGGPLVKAKKPDFEAAFAAPDGSIVILGSGSTPGRCRAARLGAGLEGVEMLDYTALYRAVAAAIGATPNVEGAVLDGDVLRLFHRGSGPEPSVVVDVPFAAAGAAEVPVLASVRCDLGRAQGVPLHFTDASPFGEGALYLAVAEDTPNAIDDGPILGAAIGLLARGRARFAWIEEPDGRPSRRKVEGLAIEPGSRTGYLVTDPDDPAIPAELCVIEIEGF